MTRDEAIKIVDELKLLDPVEPGGHQDGGIRNLVDSLAALGVLKLDDYSGDVPRCEPPPELRRNRYHALQKVDGVVDRIGFADWDGERWLLPFGDEFGKRVSPEEAASLGWRWLKVNTIAGEPYMQPETRALLRCEPPPEHREKNGSWHWIENKNYRCPAQWFTRDQWSIAGARWEAADATKHGWRYVAPCEEPRVAVPMNQHAKGEAS